jgi:hypothetical protein
MKESIFFTHAIRIPSNSTSSLHYTIQACDISGNWRKTSQYDVTISDNDRPSIIDRTPQSGSTGDEFTFNVSVADNDQIGNVCLEYWFKTGSSFNKTMSGSSYFTHTIAVPSSSLSTLHYIIRASDGSGNWANTSRSDVSIIDNDLPSIKDFSQIKATTGDLFIFNFTTIDNIGIADVCLEYWFGSYLHRNISIESGRNHKINLTIPSNSMDSLNYRLHVMDLSGNMNSTNVKSVKVNDNDPPSIKDKSQDSATTGDIYRLNVEVYDNIGVKVTYVEYWFGSGSRIHKSLEGDFMNIAIPSNCKSNLYYMLKALDCQENTVVTQERVVRVSDNDAPFIKDYTNTTMFCGEKFKIEIRAFDNIGIRNVSIEYWFGNGLKTNRTFSSGPYMINLDIPLNETRKLNYRFQASDISDNAIQSGILQINPIFDCHLAVLKDLTKSNGTTGDPFQFRIKLTQSDIIKNIYLEYSNSKKIRVNESMNSNESYYFLNVTLPESAKTLLEYRIHVSDLIGGFCSGSWKTVEVIDNDPPWYKSISKGNRRFTRGSFELSFFAEILDNTEVDYAYVNYRLDDEPIRSAELLYDGEIYTTSIEVPEEKDFIITYIFHAFDLSGNEAESELLIFEYNLDQDQENNDWEEMEGKSGIENEEEDGGVEDTVEQNIPSAPAPIFSHLVLEPFQTSIIESEYVTFSLDAFDQNGNRIPTYDLITSWKIIQGSGTIDRNGVFTTELPGTVRLRVTATYMNMTLRNETSVEVLPRKSMTVEENEHLLSDEEEENKKIKMVLFIMISAVLIIISIFGILLSLRRMISSMKIRGGGGQ